MDLSENDDSIAGMAIDSHPPIELLAKLARIARDVGVTVKDGKNASQNYGFHSAANVMAIVREKFGECGVGFSTTLLNVSFSSGKSKSGTEYVEALVRVRCTFVDLESRQAHSVEWFGSGQDYGDKALYKATTGAIREVLKYHLFISDKGDPENDDDIERADAAPPKKAAPESRDSKKATESRDSSSSKKAGHDSGSKGPVSGQMPSGGSGAESNASIIGPLSPSAIKSYMLQIAKTENDKAGGIAPTQELTTNACDAFDVITPSAQSMQALGVSVNDCFKVIEYLFNKRSPMDFDLGQCVAFLRWTKYANNIKTGEITSSDQAKVEFLHILKEVAKNAKASKPG